MNGTGVYKIYGKVNLSGSTMVICWHEESGCLGSEVSKFLTGALDMSMLAEIEPAEFFPMSGVIVENDVAKFPGCRIYISSRDNLILVDSAVPRSEWYKFISALLEIAEKHCNVAYIYTVGGMISTNQHNKARPLMATMNNPEAREYLAGYDIDLSMDYETPSGHRPTMSSYLLWEAQRRNIRGVALWVPVPFYMAGVSDFASTARVVKFLNARLNLNLETGNLDRQAERQNQLIADFLEGNADVAEIMRKFISNSGITEDESSKLANAIEEHLGHGDCY